MRQPGGARSRCTALRHAVVRALVILPRHRRNRLSISSVLVLAGAIFQEHESSWEYLEMSGPVALALNVVMMGLAFALAWLLATGPRQRVAISLECGVQNGTLAIAVGSLLFEDIAVVVPAATYSILSLGTALIFVGLVRGGLIKVEP